MQIALQDLTYAACGLWAILDQATEQLGYDWDFYNGNLGTLTVEGRQYCIRITNRDSGRSVGTSMTDHSFGIMRHKRVHSYGH